MIDELRASRKFVEVFVAENLKGTSAVVFKVEDLSCTKDLQQIAVQENAPATCFYQATSNNTYHVRFFNSINEIQLCGHGILAIAKVIAEQGSKHFSLVKNNTEVRAKYDSKQDQIWVAFKELETTPVELPAWVNKVFSTNPVSAAKAGPKDGYWVMELSQDVNLSKLLVDFNVLKENTERAVIVTQLADKGAQKHLYDYYFRYFAPQHGVLEDKATGSAHRVLVSYWGKRLNQCNVLARQLSKEGAELKGVYDNGDVWISGDVQVKG